MNEDMPWVNLTQEEVEELRNKKYELTEYGKQKLKEMTTGRFIKNPDEFVHEDVSMLHYEVMEQGRAVWLGIYLNNGKIYHLNIGGDNLYVNYSDESMD